MGTHLNICWEFEKRERIRKRTCQTDVADSLCWPVICNNNKYSIVGIYTHIVEEIHRDQGGHYFIFFPLFLSPHPRPYYSSLALASFPHCF
jgi:hypothetical protein